MSINTNRCNYFRALCLFGIVLLVCATSADAQRNFSLAEAVQLSQKQSLYFHRAKNAYEKGFWRFQNFKAGLLPEIRLNATTPTFFREIYPITQPDGSIQFRRVTQANNSLGINVIQKVAFTGGALTLGTKLQRTDNFSGDISSYFLAAPLTVSYVQGALLYNEFKWRKKIEPLQFEIAGRSYDEDVEQAALEGVMLFFEALTSQIEVETALGYRANSDTLYEISKERYKLGTVSKSDLLQLELNILKSRNIHNASLIKLESSQRTIKRLLGISMGDSLLFVLPKENPKLKVTFERAIEEARGNRHALLRFRADRLAAEEEIARAKGQNGLQFGVTANIGTQQTASNLISSYKNLQNQQYIGVSLDMPIQDWGYRKSQIRLAKANKELVEVSLQQDEINFEQEIYLQVKQFNQQSEQLLFAQKAETIAKERLKISKDRYLLGKLSVTDLNLAQEESIKSTESYVDELKKFWISYYTLRRLTLFDFATGSLLRRQTP